MSKRKPTGNNIGICAFEKIAAAFAEDRRAAIEMRQHYHQRFDEASRRIEQIPSAYNPAQHEGEEHKIIICQ